MHQRTCGAPSGPFRPRTSAQRHLQTDRSAQSYKLRHLLREIGDSSRVLGDGVHWQRHNQYTSQESPQPVAIKPRHAATMGVRATPVFLFTFGQAGGSTQPFNVDSLG
jgi:hypothetical protein